MNKKQISVIVIIFIIALNIIGSFIYSFEKYDGNIGTMKEVNKSCYDRYSNEIEGLICKSEVIDEYDLYLTIGLSLSFILIFVSLGLLAFVSQELDE